MFSDEELTSDAFLGGRLRLLQPRSGYRAGIDPVLLASAVPAKAGERVLELGAGAGTAVLCLVARISGLRATAVELQPAYADLARRNAAANGLALEVVEADLRSLPAELRERSFDHVLMNPPYFRTAGRSAAMDLGRELARAGETPLPDWLKVGMKRLAPEGRLTVIQAAERLGEVLAALPASGVVVRPLAARVGRAADRVIVTLRKGSRAALRLEAPLILHRGPQHVADGDDYAPWASAVLREAAGLPETA